jgi:hypothetical protein
MMINSDDYNIAENKGSKAAEDMTDKEVHKAYADLMGWETEKIKNGWGKGTFVFDDETS